MMEMSAGAALRRIEKLSHEGHREAFLFTLTTCTLQAPIRITSMCLACELASDRPNSNAQLHAPVDLLTVVGACIN